MIKCLLGLLLFAFFSNYKVNTPTANLYYSFSVSVGAVSTFRISIGDTSLMSVLLAFELVSLTISSGLVPST